MKIKVLILAAGYGTRLERGARTEYDGKYAHLIGLNKALVPLGGTKTVLGEWWRLIQDAEREKALSDVRRNTYIVTNNRHFGSFESWALQNNFPKQNVLNDGSDSNENRLGAIADIEFAVARMRADEQASGVAHGSFHLVILAGDTLFGSDFRLSSPIGEFWRHLREDSKETGLEQGERSVPLAIILQYMLDDHKEVSKRGIIEMDPQTNRVLQFLEKPKPSETQSNMAVPAFYIYSHAALEKLTDFLASTSTKKERDAPGRFIQWLWSRIAVYACRIERRIDIGSLEDYIEVLKLYE